MATGRRAGYAKQIRELALSLPETYEDHPWGFPVFKVAENRMFAWLFEGDPVEVTVKLTREEREIAELLPFTRRASYVGRYGWIATIGARAVPRMAAQLTRSRRLWLRAPAELRDAVEETPP